MSPVNSWLEGRRDRKDFQRPGIRGVRGKQLGSCPLYRNKTAIQGTGSRDVIDAFSEGGEVGSCSEADALGIDVEHKRTDWLETSRRKH